MTSDWLIDLTDSSWTSISPESIFELACPSGLSVTIPLIKVSILQIVLLYLFRQIRVQINRFVLGSSKLRLFDKGVSALKSCFVFLAIHEIWLISERSFQISWNNNMFIHWDTFIWINKHSSICFFWIFNEFQCKITNLDESLSSPRYYKIGLFLTRLEMPCTKKRKWFNY